MLSLIIRVKLIEASVSTMENHLHKRLSRVFKVKGNKYFKVNCTEPEISYLNFQSSSVMRLDKYRTADLPHSAHVNILFI